ncbi:hypothetical protein DYD21_17035 [Rhodohalobacter sp. SW132]|nr:hypothetical protein DYD21_17035 [Rhodohalobacter sp. SW132]
MFSKTADHFYIKKSGSFNETMILNYRTESDPEVSSKNVTRFFSITLQSFNIKIYESYGIIPALNPQGKSIL